MAYVVSSEHEYPRITPGVQVLLALNAMLMVVQWAVVSPEDMRAALGFQWGNLESGRWWTAVTYLFVHGSIWHLAGNLYFLFAFGPRLEHDWGTRRFLSFYVLSGLGGLAVYALFLRNGILFGSSAAVFGVVGAYAMRWPRDEVFLFSVLPMRVWTLVAAFIAYDLLVGVYGAPVNSGSVAHAAHLGGLVVAWFYVRTQQGMSIEQLRQRMAQAPDPTDEPPRAIPRSPRTRERMDEVDEIVAKSRAAVAKRPSPVAPPRARPQRAEDVNRVLDKISAQGIESLTSDERKVLEEFSRTLREDA